MWNAAGQTAMHGGAPLKFDRDKPMICSTQSVFGSPVTATALGGHAFCDHEQNDIACDGSKLANIARIITERNS